MAIHNKTGWHIVNAAQAVLLAGMLILSSSLNAQSTDFSNEYNRVFQIRSISNDADEKSSIESGFQVSSDGLVVTNYHVVSQFITQPDSYTLQFAAQDGSTGELKLLDFDIVNDLAILEHPNPKPSFFKLASQTPERGVVSYALGNPGDWGMVMVPNGYVEHSYNKRLLFSGSLNPGMSGGPSLNADREVVGVNVATAGSQLSFLVPAEKVRKLIAEKRAIKPSEFDQHVANQLKIWQRPRLQQLIDQPWDNVDFLGHQVPSELRHDFQCWGQSNDDNEERAVNTSSKSCSAGDHVYINNILGTGQIKYNFTHHTPKKLNNTQFALQQGMDMWANNYSEYQYSTDYVCHSDFLNQSNESEHSYTRIISCVRGYKKNSRGYLIRW